MLLTNSEIVAFSPRWKRRRAVDSQEKKINSQFQVRNIERINELVLKAYVKLSMDCLTLNGLKRIQWMKFVRTT